ncbi:MAG: MerC domain-containing protein [Planctomycetes bacterium]|nr:MerC domain-containing protein [Planctomycetota bacterium]
MATLTSVLDRTGVFASVFCAIHCAVAPLLLVVAPTLGGVWVHPLAHLAIAALVLPVAGFALRRGFRDHGRRWVVAVGGAGIALVLVGAVLPYLAGSPVAGHEHCQHCCPSLVVDEATGAETLHVPPATIVTLLGGALLVTAHLANLRCGAGCRLHRA